MNSKATQIVEILTQQNKKISVMESCTGGAFANELTNVPGSSNVFEFGAVTYANSFKTKLGVSENVLNKFSVYSPQTAKEMSQKIAEFSNADFGVGITGKLKKVDAKNGFGDDDEVFFCIFSKQKNQFFEGSLIVTKNLREDNKNLVLEAVFSKILQIL